MVMLFRVLVLFLIVSIAFSVSAEDTLKAVMFRLTPENYKDYFPKIGLALGGGSAKGIAHIGVLEILEEENIPIHYIAGTSMGSVIGSLYSCGYSPKEIRDILKSIDPDQIFSDIARDRPAAFSWGSLNNPTLFRYPEEGPVGLSSGQHVRELLREWTLAQAYKAHFDFDRLPIKLRVVATDFLKGEKVVFSSGPIDRAVRASTSIPLIFKPLAYKNTYLVDGGSLEVVPIAEVKSFSPEISIGVNVARTLPLPRDKINNFTDFSLHLFDVLSTPAIENNLGQADILVDIPPTESLTTNDYLKVDQFVKYGRDHFKKYLKILNKKLAERTLGQEKYILKEVVFEGIDQQQDVFETDLAYSELEIVRNIYPLIKEHAQREAEIHLVPISDLKYKLKVIFTPAVELKRITWEGNRIPFSPKLREALKVYRGQKYSPQLLQQISETIAEDYRKEGYILVELDPVLIKDELHFKIYEVPILEVSTEGNRYTSTSVLESFLRFKTPEIYNSHKVEQAVQQLYATELFTEVEPEVIRQEEGVHLKFNLVERPYGIFYANAQYYSTEDRVELDFGHKNNYAFGYRLKSYLNFVTGPKNDINFGLAHYNIFDTGLGWGFDYLKHQELITTYAEHERGSEFFNDQEDNSVYLEYWFLNYSIASLTRKSRRQYILEKDKLKFPDYQKVLYLTDIAFKWDTLEKDFLANRGGNLILHTEKSEKVDYERSWGSSTLAFPIKKKVSINLKNYLGTSSGDINYYDHYFLRRRWLPYGFADLEAQGPNIYYTRLSYRFPILGFLRGEAGLDMFRSWMKTGTAIDRFENTGTAFSLHYPSFIGLASLTYGVRNDGNSVWLVFLSNALEE
ncbi:patatin-like phospholipase family protein [Candidatus Margulisiibacteriota bacterium]